MPYNHQLLVITTHICTCKSCMEWLTRDEVLETVRVQHGALNVVQHVSSACVVAKAGSARDTRRGFRPSWTAIGPTDGKRHREKRHATRGMPGREARRMVAVERVIDFEAQHPAVWEVVGPAAAARGRARAVRVDAAVAAAAQPEPLPGPEIAVFGP
jgi:hypothetical protein